MDKMIGYCGINCEKCEARIATIKDDDKMREEVSRKWCELFHTDIITPDKINCMGCVKTASTSCVTLPISFQFHHVQMDGGHAARFLEEL
jgi:hypothetical protein